MRLKGKSGFALFLIACGALILLDKVGLGFGGLLGLLLPIGMIGLGYIGFQNGRKLIGCLLMGFGSIFLLGKFSGLFGILAAVGLIAYGVSALKRNATH